MCALLAPLAQRILLVPVANERTAAPAELAQACRAANRAANITPCNSLAEAFELARPDPFVVIAGSLYLIGEAMEQLDLSPEISADERRLNEWVDAARSPRQ